MSIPKKYYIWLVLGFLLLISVEFIKKQQIDWRPTFSTFDNIPYGSDVIYRLAKEGKWKNNIEQSNKTFYEYYAEDSSSFTTVFLANNIHFDENSIQKLLEHVANGNTAILLSNSISWQLLDTLKIKINYASIHKKQDTIALNTETYFIDSVQQIVPNKRIPYFEWNKNNHNIYCLGTRNGYANFIAINFGNGKIYLNNDPLFFTNYYLLHKISFRYVTSIFSMLPSSRIVWDDYMIYGHRKPPSEMRLVLSSVPMRIAYYILTVLLILYLSLAWRRKQRVIPIVEPITNSSIEFINTLTNLYLSNKNNGKIAQYLINNFRIKMNRNYFIHWNKPKNQITDQLISKSGKTKQEVENLLNQLAISDKKQIISQKDLLKINKTLEDFISK